MSHTLFRCLLLVLVVTGATACVDEVQLPIRQVEPRLVVDGLITDEPPPYAIKLTFSGAYRSGAGFPEELAVNGALVTVSDDQGRTVRLRQDPLTPTYYYLRDTTFRGQVGRNYTLRVTLIDGRTFVSDPEKLRSGPPIERLYADYQRSPAGLVSPAQYNVLLDTKDPADPDNYYRWSAYDYSPRWPGGVPTTFAGVNLNVCWSPTYGPFTDVLSDALINGNSISRRPVLTSPVYAVGKHYVEVRQYSLTREAFQYWNRFEEQRSRTGSLFDPQPASIEGNVHRQDDASVLALGYFGASSVSRKRLMIPGDTLNYNQFIVRYGGLFAGGCSTGAWNFPPNNWLNQ